MYCKVRHPKKLRDRWICLVFYAIDHFEFVSHLSHHAWELDTRIGGKMMSLTDRLLVLERSVQLARHDSRWPNSDT